MTDVVQKSMDFFMGFARKRGLGKPDKVMIANEPFEFARGVACEWNQPGEPIRNGLLIHDPNDCRKTYRRLREWKN